ncbi:MAG: rhomboid family intramembrane serine protease [Cytophagales bacterium]|nr:rhomboid family intramembrane serine protease [Cytophagales bacterium]
MSLFVNERAEHLKFRYAVYLVISFILLLWIIKAIEIASGVSFSSLGVLPRTLKGTIGIFTGPLIHGDMIHLLSNTLPILLLGIMLFYFYHRIAIEIFIWIYLVTGFWTWLMARDAYHIGASGIVYGMASFLFFSGIFRKSRQLMTISAIIIFLYGGMIYGIFPQAVEAEVSWESHLMGGIAGFFLAFLFRRVKIDHDTESIEEHSDEEDPGTSIHHTGNFDNTKITYTYKPADKCD